MADRVAVINQGEIVLVEEKAELMRKLGKKQLTLHLLRKIERIPEALGRYPLSLSGDGRDLVYTYDSQQHHSVIPELLRDIGAAGIELKDLHTTQSSLEDIFVDLVRQAR